MTAGDFLLFCHKIKGEITVLQLEGSLTTPNVMRLVEELHLIRRGHPPQIIVDLQHLCAMDEIGLAFLKASIQYYERLRIVFHIQSLPPMIAAKLGHDKNRYNLLRQWMETMIREQPECLVEYGHDRLGTEMAKTHDRTN